MYVVASMCVCLPVVGLSPFAIHRYKQLAMGHLLLQGVPNFFLVDTIAWCAVCPHLVILIVLTTSVCTYTGASIQSDFALGVNLRTLHIVAIAWITGRPLWLPPRS